MRIAFLILLVLTSEVFSQSQGLSQRIDPYLIWRMEFGENNPHVVVNHTQKLKNRGHLDKFPIQGMVNNDSIIWLNDKGSIRQIQEFEGPYYIKPFIVGIDDHYAIGRKYHHEGGWELEYFAHGKSLWKQSLVSRIKLSENRTVFIGDGEEDTSNILVNQGGVYFKNPPDKEKSYPHALRMSPDDRFFLTYRRFLPSRLQSVSFHKTEGEIIWTKKHDEQGLANIHNGAISPNGNYITYALGISTLYLFNAKGDILWEKGLSESDDPLKGNIVFYTSFSEDENRLAVYTKSIGAHNNGKVTIYDTRSGSISASFMPTSMGKLASLNFIKIFNNGYSIISTKEQQADNELLVVRVYDSLGNDYWSKAIKLIRPLPVKWDINMRWDASIQDNMLIIKKYETVDIYGLWDLM